MLVLYKGRADQTVTNALSISWLRTKAHKRTAVREGEPQAKKEELWMQMEFLSSCFLNSIISSQESQPIEAEFSPFFWPSKTCHLFKGGRGILDLQLAIRQEMVKCPSFVPETLLSAETFWFYAEITGVVLLLHPALCVFIFFFPTVKAFQNDKEENKWNVYRHNMH